jgi:thiamine biosynthesis protein ThiI
VFQRAALIHYHEIGLKGRNRSTFEDRLRSNLEFAVRGMGAGPPERISSRILMPLPAGSESREAVRACAAVPGVARVADALVLSRQMDDVRKAAAIVLGEAVSREREGAVRTFAVDARRSVTDHPVSSTEMNVDVGAHLRKVTGMDVDLGSPDATVWIEIVQGAAYVYSMRLPGPGGLPVGTSGVVVALLSGGIDSPVAAWRMAKRGAVIVAVHFSGAPQTAGASTSDVFDLVDALAPCGGIARVYSVPIGDLQRAISLECPPDLRVLLYRRLMVRVAGEVARAEGAKALVTGESLGQVASQTLDNIAAVDAVTTLPVLRPLIGADKDEIISEARRLGTYEISIRAHDDCCTLFMPRTPATHATTEQVDAAETGLDTARMVVEALSGAVRRDFPCASYRAPATAPGTPWEG